MRQSLILFMATLIVWFTGVPASASHNYVECDGISPVSTECVRQFVVEGPFILSVQTEFLGELTIEVTSETGSWTTRCYHTLSEPFYTTCEDIYTGRFEIGQSAQLAVSPTSDTVGHWRIRVASSH